MIVTYVAHEDKTYRVSTINRDCSSIESYGSRYAETLVWEYDNKERKIKGSILYSDTSPEGSIVSHLITVKNIHQKGIKEEQDD